MGVEYPCLFNLQNILLTYCSSLAWAELYVLLSALVQRFDLELEESGLKNVECVSDQFIIGTKDRNGIEAFVRKRSL